MRNFVQWCDFIKVHRSPLQNDERKFGAQFVVDEADELVRVEDSMLLASTDLSIQEVVEKAAALSGVVIAAHIDRPAFSLLSQLGFIPPDIFLHAVEVSRRLDWQTARQKFPMIGRLPVITSSDAHTIDEFISGPKTMFLVESPTLAEMQQALEASNGRRIHR